MHRLARIRRQYGSEILICVTASKFSSTPRGELKTEQLNQKSRAAILRIGGERRRHAAPGLHMEPAACATQSYFSISGFGVAGGEGWLEAKLAAR